MNNFQLRREILELSENMKCQNDFYKTTNKVKKISDWAADQLGLTDQEKEQYKRRNISNIIRENEVAKMIKRIERDFFEANIEIEEDVNLNQLK